MLVGNDYKVEADNLNINLYKKGKTGQWRAIGLFSKFGNALKALVDLEVRETGLKDLRAVCQKQDELYKLIEALKISSNGVK